MTDLSPGLSLSSGTIALRVAHELRLLTERLHAIEGALDDLLERDDLNLRKDTISHLQQMDVISQAVIALAEFLERTGPDMCADDAVEAGQSLRQVRLKALADRLSGDNSTEGHDSELVLF